MSKYEPRVRYYEDITIGETFESLRRTVTDADIMAYAGVSGDFNRVHTDEEYMKTTPFGGRIAHGLLCVAISSGLAGRGYFDEIQLQAHLETTFRFENAVRPGDTIHTIITARDKRETKDPTRGVIKFGREIFNQRGQRTAVGESALMVLRRPSAP